MSIEKPNCPHSPRVKPSIPVEPPSVFRCSTMRLPIRCHALAVTYAKAKCASVYIPTRTWPWHT